MRGLEELLARRDEEVIHLRSVVNELVHSLSKMAVLVDNNPEIQSWRETEE